MSISDMASFFADKMFCCLQIALFFQILGNLAKFEYANRNLVRHYVSLLLYRETSI